MNNQGDLGAQKENETSPETKLKEGSNTNQK